MNKGKIIEQKLTNDLRFLPTYLYDGYMKEKKRKERIKKYNKIYEKL